MGGRGRGRGRGAVPPSVASAPFNFGRSSSNAVAGASINGIYPSRSEPSQKFPDILIPDAPKFEDFSELQLRSCYYSEKINNMMKISPAFRPIKTTQNKMDRYSDRYLSHVINANEKKERLSSIKSSLDFFPEELHTVYTVTQGGGSDSLKLMKKKSSATNTSASFKDTLSHLDALAQKEESSHGESERGEEDEDDENEGHEEVDDEEFEDETDYNFSYFDNGEDHGDYDDGNDEAVF